MIFVFHKYWMSRQALSNILKTCTKLFVSMTELNKMLVNGYETGL